MPVAAAAMSAGSEAVSVNGRAKDRSAPPLLAGPVRKTWSTKARSAPARNSQTRIGSTTKAPPPAVVMSAARPSWRPRSRPTASGKATPDRRTDEDPGRLLGHQAEAEQGAGREAPGGDRRRSLGAQARARGPAREHREGADDEVGGAGVVADVAARHDRRDRRDEHRDPGRMDARDPGVEGRDRQHPQRHHRQPERGERARHDEVHDPGEEHLDRRHDQEVVAIGDQAVVEGGAVEEVVPGRRREIPVPPQQQVADAEREDEREPEPEGITVPWGGRAGVGDPGHAEFETRRV